AEEDLLDRLLDVGAIAEAPRHEGVDPREVALVEQVERPPIAAADDAPDQLVVVDPLDPSRFRSSHVPRPFRWLSDPALPAPRPKASGGKVAEVRAEVSKIVIAVPRIVSDEPPRGWGRGPLLSGGRRPAW